MLKIIALFLSDVMIIQLWPIKNPGHCFYFILAIASPELWLFCPWSISKKWNTRYFEGAVIMFPLGFIILRILSNWLVSIWRFFLYQVSCRPYLLSILFKGGEEIVWPESEAANDSINAQHWFISLSYNCSSCVIKLCSVGFAFCNKLQRKDFVSP